MYKFTVDWFDSNISSWELIKKYKNWGDQTPINIVEIGSFEGRSSCWIADNLLGHSSSRLYCIDNFKGSMEHTAEHKKDLYERFKYNINCTKKTSQIVVLKGNSDEKLIELINNDIYADLIYIDGSHLAKDVLVDAVLSWKILKKSGIMIFDDYIWIIDNNDFHNNPKLAIDSFTNIFFKEIKFLSGIRNGQFYIEKK